LSSAEGLCSLELVTHLQSDMSWMGVSLAERNTNEVLKNNPQHAFAPMTQVAVFLVFVCTCSQTLRN